MPPCDTPVTQLFSYPLPDSRGSGYLSALMAKHSLYCTRQPEILSDSEIPCSQHHWHPAAVRPHHKAWCLINKTSSQKKRKFSRAFSKVHHQFMSITVTARECRACLWSDVHPEHIVDRIWYHGGFLPHKPLPAKLLIPSPISPWYSPWADTWQHSTPMEMVNPSTWGIRLKSRKTKTNSSLGKQGAKALFAQCQPCEDTQQVTDCVSLGLLHMCRV